MTSFLSSKILYNDIHINLLMFNSFGSIFSNFHIFIFSKRNIILIKFLLIKFFEYICIRKTIHFFNKDYMACMFINFRIKILTLHKA